MHTHLLTSPAKIRSGIDLVQCKNQHKARTASRTKGSVDTEDVLKGERKKGEKKFQRLKITGESGGISDQAVWS